MYRYKLPDNIITQLKGIYHQDGIRNALEGLQDSPMARAKQIANNDNFGKYYVNAGNKYCLCFDIDEETREISINYLCRQAFLYKILTRKIC